MMTLKEYSRRLYTRETVELILLHNDGVSLPEFVAPGSHFPSVHNFSWKMIHFPSVQRHHAFD